MGTLRMVRARRYNVLFIGRRSIISDKQTSRAMLFFKYASPLVFAHRQNAVSFSGCALPPVEVLQPTSLGMIHYSLLMVVLGRGISGQSCHTSCHTGECLPRSSIQGGGGRSSKSKCRIPMLCCGGESELGPDGRDLGGAHEIEELLGESRIAGLPHHSGQHCNGWVELGWNRKLA